MKKILNNIIKCSIKLMFGFGVTWPLVLIYARVIKEVMPVNGKDSKKAKTLLALNPDRFRGDLEVLAATNDFRVLKVPLDWQCKILSLYWPKKSNKSYSRERYFNPEGDREIIELQTKFRSFLKIFLEALYKKLSINGVIGAGVWYIQDYDWGWMSKEIGVPYIVLHRENLATVSKQREYYLNRLERLNKFRGNQIIAHNLVMKELLIQSGYVSSDKVSAMGCLRMDKFIGQVKNSKKHLKARRKVLLFSFHYGVGLQNVRDPGFVNRDLGLVNLFEHVHVSFAKLAMKRKNVDFVIKPKWGGPWIDEISYVLSKNSIEISGIDNLQVLVDIDVHDLIMEADVVCGYGSTTLLEAAIAGKPVIVPYFDEVLKPEYSDNISFKECLHIFDVANSVEDFGEFIIHRLAYPEITEECMEERCAVFNKYISSMDGNALGNYVKEINQVISKVEAVA